MTRSARGRHFLQNPGPTDVPDRALRAMDRPTIDIGHLGSFNELMLAGTLSGIELGLCAIGHAARGGVTTALDYLSESA